MISSFLLVGQQVLVLFALMGVGYVCARRRLLDEQAIKGLVELLIVIVTPCLIVHAFQRPFERHLLAGLGWTCAAAAGVHLAGIAASFLVREACAPRQNVLRYAVIFSNAGFMGLPLEQALLGDTGVFYGAVYVAVFNLICWSYGLVVMCGSMRDLCVRTLVVNPGLVGLALGLPFFLGSVKLPPVLGEPVRMIADVNTPLAMIVIGFYLAGADCRAVVHCAAARWTAVLRLLVLPLAVLGALYGVCRLFPTIDPVLAKAVVIAASAPVAALTTMMAARYHQDVPVSVGIVMGTTLLSALTMPPVIGLALWLLS